MSVKRTIGRICCPSKKKLIVSLSLNIFNKLAIKISFLILSLFEQITFKNLALYQCI